LERCRAREKHSLLQVIAVLRRLDAGVTGRRRSDRRAVNRREQAQAGTPCAPRPEDDIEDQLRSLGLHRRITPVDSHDQTTVDLGPTFFSLMLVIAYGGIAKLEVAASVSSLPDPTACPGLLAGPAGLRLVGKVRLK